MEVKGIGSNYSVQSAQTAKNSAETESFESKLQTAVDTGDDKELKKVCKDFESIMLGMMFKSMRASVDKSGLVDEDQGTETFQSMLDDEIVKSASDAGGIGLADVLYKQLKKQSSSATSSDSETKSAE